jgi:hypothetical protein
MLQRRMIAGAVLAIGVLTGTGSHGQNPVHAPPPDSLCPGDKVVWVNTNLRVYYYRGERYFGNTMQGKFTCETTAVHEGDRSGQ